MYLYTQLVYNIDMLQAKFTYSPLGKAYEKQIKAIENQGEKQVKALEEHGKQLVKTSSEKESLTLLKRKNFLKNLLMKDV